MMENFQILEKFKSVRQSILPFDAEVVDAFHHGEALTIEIAAGNTPKSFEYALQRANERFIALDVKSPSLKKIKRFANGQVPDNFLYLYGEDYLGIFDLDLRISKIDLFFPVPVPESLGWFGKLIDKLKHSNHQLRIDLFTEIPYESISFADGHNAIYTLRCDFITDLYNLLGEKQLPIQCYSLSFDEFHSMYGYTETSKLISGDYMLPRKGVAHFTIQI